MARTTVIPFFGKPPAQYNPQYLNDVVRAFSQFAVSVTNPGEGRNTNIVITNMPQNDVGLEVGTLYRHGNVVHIVTADVAAMAGVSMSISLGSVTVSVS